MVEDGIKWMGDEDKAVAVLPDGSKVAVRYGNEVTTLDEVVERLRAQHKGDDLPILLEAFGCDYDAACDAVFSDDHDRALAMLNAATAAPTAVADVRDDADLSM